jgi:hypothetical protein
MQQNPVAASIRQISGEKAARLRNYLDRDFSGMPYD